MIGRKKELEIFEHAIQDDRSHFIAVYGRRRVGKTFLIRESFRYRFTFQHAGLSDSGLKEQLFAFETAIRDAGGTPSDKVHNWLEAFEDLKELIRQSTEKKKILFLDELSWMDTRNSDLMTALEHFWNGWASARKDIILVICTSATSWMLSKVIHHKGGLYHRLTEQIDLRPFTLAECEEIVRAEDVAWNRDQILQYYMIFGGIPYYWEFLRKGESLPQTIDRILFAANAPLKGEFRCLYDAIFRNPEPYLRIIRALAGIKAGMTRDELIAGTGLHNSGDLTMRLEELESCGFIRKYTAYGKKKKNTVYQLIDAFTLFYYQFLKDEPTDEHFWESQINSSQINAWSGLAFERVCLLHVAQIKKKLGISGILTEVHSWYCKPDPDRGIHGSQIDLLIVRKDQVINLCEMKYSDAEYTLTKREDEAIRRRVSDLRIATGTDYAIYPTLVTTRGLVDNSYAGNIQVVVTQDDLFAQ